MRVWGTDETCRAVYLLLLMLLLLRLLTGLRSADGVAEPWSLHPPSPTSEARKQPGFQTLNPPPRLAPVPLITPGCVLIPRGLHKPAGFEPPLLLSSSGQGTSSPGSTPQLLTTYWIFMCLASPSAASLLCPPGFKLLSRGERDGEKNTAASMRVYPGARSAGGMREQRERGLLLPAARRTDVQEEMEEKTEQKT